MMLYQFIEIFTINCIQKKSTKGIQQKKNREEEHQKCI